MLPTPPIDAGRPWVWPGSVAIVALGALALAATGLLIPLGPSAVGAVGGAAVAVLGAGLAVRSGRTVQTGVVLVLGAALFGGEPGVSPAEALFFAAAMLLLVSWYGAAALGARRVVASLDDAVALLWLGVGVALALVVSVVVARNPTTEIRAEAIALFPFFLYLPIKETVARHRWGLALVVGALAWYAIYSTLLNAATVRTVVAEATVWYEVANVRFTTGETAMAATVLIGLSVLPTLGGRSLRARVVWLGLATVVMVALAGLVVAKSRGYWLVTVFGLVLALAVSPAETRRKGLLVLVGGVAVLSVLAWAVVPEQVFLLVEGLVIRFASFSSVGTDPSLLARYAESAAAWSQIRLNPIVGYGWGHQIVYYSSLGEGTQHWSFMHNMYLWVWHKVGLWGLALLLALWGRAVLRGARAARSRQLTLAERSAAAGAVGTAAALGVVGLTSNPLGVPDAALVVTLVLALAHGLGQRADAAEHGL